MLIDREMGTTMAWSETGSRSEFMVEAIDVFATTDRLLLAPQIIGRMSD
jgi:hypothetical protein